MCMCHTCKTEITKLASYTRCVISHHFSSFIYHYLAGQLSINCVCCSAVTTRCYAKTELFTHTHTLTHTHTMQFAFPWHYSHSRSIPVSSILILCAVLSAYSLSTETAVLLIYRIFNVNIQGAAQNLSWANFDVPTTVIHFWQIFQIFRRNLTYFPPICGDDLDTRDLNCGSLSKELFLRDIV